MSGKALFPEAADGARKRRGSDAELDITPMIDVTFLLLIFFMVTSTMRPPQDVDVPRAEYGAGVDAEDAMVLTIRAPAVPGDTPGLLLRDGREGTVEQVREDVEAGVREMRNRVVIKADREVPNGFVDSVMKAVSEVSGIQFFIEVRDKH